MNNNLADLQKKYDRRTMFFLVILFAATFMAAPSIDFFKNSLRDILQASFLNIPSPADKQILSQEKSLMDMPAEKTFRQQDAAVSRDGGLPKFREAEYSAPKKFSLTKNESHLAILNKIKSKEQWRLFLKNIPRKGKGIESIHFKFSGFPVSLNEIKELEKAYELEYVLTSDKSLLGILENYGGRRAFSYDRKANMALQRQWTLNKEDDNSRQYLRDKQEELKECLRNQYLYNHYPSSFEAFNQFKMSSRLCWGSQMLDNYYSEIIRLVLLELNRLGEGVRKEDIGSIKLKYKKNHFGIYILEPVEVTLGKTGISKKLSMKT